MAEASEFIAVGNFHHLCLIFASEAEVNRFFLFFPHLAAHNYGVNSTTWTLRKPPRLLRDVFKLRDILNDRFQRSQAKRREDRPVTPSSASLDGSDS